MQIIPASKSAARRTPFLAGAFVAFTATTTFAAIIAPNTDFTNGVPFGADIDSTALGGSLAGTVLVDVTNNFAESVGPGFQGTMRSVVVVRDDNGKLDFYYQLTNTSQDAPVNQPAGQTFGELFRLSIDGGYSGVGFANDNLEGYVRSDGLAGITGAGSFVNGTESPYSGDRPASDPNSFGFQFSVDPISTFGDARNVDSGEISRFLLIRTNATSYGFTTFSVSGFGTGQAAAYAPTPEPGSTAFLALGMLSLGLRRKRA